MQMTDGCKREIRRGAHGSAWTIRRNAVARACRPAVTLIEVVVTTATMTVLLGGIGSALVVASRALPGPRDQLGAAIAAASVVGDIAAELYCAQTVTELAPAAIEFTVADRNNDAAPETIRYAWSGTDGDSLTRAYNGAAAVAVFDDVREFALRYYYLTDSYTTQKDAVAETDEATLASFEGWTGITPNYVVCPLGTSDWAAVYFVLAPPNGATQLKITQASFMLRTDDLTGLSRVTASVYRPAVSGSAEPGAAMIGTAGSRMTADLTTDVTPFWTSFTLSGVTVDLTGKPIEQFVVVLKSEGTNTAEVRLLNSKSAPNDSTVGIWSDDGGASWDPRSNARIQNDIPFRVTGTYQSSGLQDVTVDSFFLKSVGVRLRSGTDDTTGVESTTAILNVPEVTSP